MGKDKDEKETIRGLKEILHRCVEETDSVYILWKVYSEFMRQLTDNR